MALIFAVKINCYIVATYQKSGRTLEKLCNAFDEAACLSRHVASLEETFNYTLLDGTPVRFQCLLTGDHFYWQCMNNFWKLSIIWLMEMGPMERQWRCRTICQGLSAGCARVTPTIQQHWHFKMRFPMIVHRFKDMNRWTALVVVTVLFWVWSRPIDGWGITTIVQHAWWMLFWIAWRFQCNLYLFFIYK